MIGVVIASYGPGWRRLMQRAYASVREQTVYTPVHVEHWEDPADVKLHQFRNFGAAQLLKDHPQLTRIVFLDADDELDPGYTAAMESAIMSGSQQGPVIVTPSVMNVEDGLSDFPYGLHHESRPIGCTIPVKLFEHMGGFEPWPVLEDMAFWLRAEMECGAAFVPCRQAIYIAHNDAPVRRNPPNGSERSNRTASAIRTFKGSYEKFREAMGGNL